MTSTVHKQEQNVFIKQGGNKHAFTCGSGAAHSEKDPHRVAQLDAHGQERGAKRERDLDELSLAFLLFLQERGLSKQM